MRHRLPVDGAGGAGEGPTRLWMMDGVFSALTRFPSRSTAGRSCRRASDCRQTASQTSPRVAHGGAGAIYILPPPTVSEATIQIGSETMVGGMRTASEKPPRQSLRFHARLNRTTLLA